MFLTDGASHWQNRLATLGVTCVEVSDRGVELTAVLGEFGTSHGFVTTGSHEVFGEYPRLTELTHFSRSRSVLGEAPVCGAHTEKVLAEFTSA